MYKRQNKNGPMKKGMTSSAMMRRRMPTAAPGPLAHPGFSVTDTLVPSCPTGFSEAVAGAEVGEVATRCVLSCGECDIRLTM